MEPRCGTIRDRPHAQRARPVPSRKNMTHCTGLVALRRLRSALSSTLRRTLVAALPFVVPLALSFAPAAHAERPKEHYILLPGFREFYANSYTPSAKNVALLNQLKIGATTPRRVAFHPDKKQFDWLLCRGSYPIYAPGQASFATLLEAAVNLELQQAGLASEDGPKVQIWLDQFDFSSALFGNAHWAIDLTLADEGKPPISVTSVHEFEGRHGAGTACGQISFQLQTALEGVLFKLYSAPGFSALFR
ncbi:hypothetical protein HLB44_22745 [Aquincola sp. S2]|uniref:Lipid/polyisoprenoid-binding YceI-like domain-containing protein n=1 Tax=Pseudaquabacterium terrae TaxID=2732868 RepID=A0ABX2EME5_9BURK|nr:hypothetical protein [Aquabacterium terrae]